jgi:hypothetical protein
MMQHGIALMFFPETRSGRSAVCTLPHLRMKITFSETCVQVVCTILMTAAEKEKLRFRLRLKCDGTRTETRFHLSIERTSPFKSAGVSVQSTTGSRGVRIRGSNAGYTMFQGSVKSTGCPLHSPVSPSLPPLCITVCHHVSNTVYLQERSLLF